MIFVLFATILCAATAYALRGGVLAGPRIVVAGLDGVGMSVVMLGFSMAFLALGPLFGISLIASLALNEFGRVVAYRMIGHNQARFRLVPVPGWPVNSEEPLNSEADAFFVALMGPGISMAPMVMAYALSVMLADLRPDIAEAFRVFAVTCGTLNFIHLLPFWPLNGGRCTRIFSKNFWPTLAPAMTVFMSAAFLSAAIRTGSIGLLIVAGIGAQSLFYRGEPRRTPLGPDNALIAMAAYTFTFAAHFCGGWWLLSQYF